MVTGGFVDGVYDISMVMLALLRRNLDGMSVLLRGLRLLRCLSTHFSMVSTESVLGRRRSAEVRIMCDDATRNVAAIPFNACGIRDGSML